MAAHPRHKIPGGPGRGGARPGAGRKADIEEIVRLIHRADPQRCADASPEKKAAIAAIHKKLIELALVPGRHAQTQASIYRAMLDEVTGKMSDNLNVKEHNVTVEIVQTPAASPAPEKGTAPGADSVEGTEAVPNPDRMLE